MKEPVAVILSRYGTCVYLEEQLDSLRKQTMRPELFIRSDDPPDNLGVNGSYTTLLGMVPESFRYIMFSDQDDVWLPEKVERSHEAMKAAEKTFSGPVLVHSDSRVVDENLKTIKKHFVRRYARNTSFMSTLMFNKVQGATMMINRPLCDLVGPVPAGMMYDRYIHLVAELAGIRKFLDVPLMLYRQHGNNVIGAGGPKPVNTGFLSPDDRVLLHSNLSFRNEYGNYLAGARRRDFEEYLAYMETDSPAKRARFVGTHLRRYPDIMLKKLAKLGKPS